MKCVTWVFLAITLICCFTATSCRILNRIDQQSSTQPNSSNTEGGSLIWSSSSATPKITKATIQWQESAKSVYCTWEATGLNSQLEYWVFPDLIDVGEGPPTCTKTPEQLAGDMELRYQLIKNDVRLATDGVGVWFWNSKPPRPDGTLALISYNPATKKASVVAISAQFDTSRWR